MSTHPIERLWRNVGLPECFLGNGGTNHGLYKLYDAIVQSERDAAAAPTFEAGKSYRTRGGQHIKNVRPIGTMIRGHRVCDDLDFVWYPDGRTVPGETNFNDLLPGAIEDEKAETNTYSPEQYERLQAEINERKSAAVDPICVLQGQIETLTAAIIQLQAAEIARGDRELNAALEQMDEQPDAPEDREYRSDLRQIHSRLNRQAERFEELSHKLESAFGRTTNQ